MMFPGGSTAYDRAVGEASDLYSGRMHNLFCDNCHSHVARALNSMEYDGSTRWNMVTLALLMLVHGKSLCLLSSLSTGVWIKYSISPGKYVSCGAAIKTWLPFFLLAAIIVITVVCSHLNY